MCGTAIAAAAALDVYHHCSTKTGHRRSGSGELGDGRPPQPGGLEPGSKRKWGATALGYRRRRL